MRANMLLPQPPLVLAIHLLQPKRPEALAENEASNEEKNGSAVTSASSARGTSSNNGNDSKGAPWLPIAGIVAGCAGLVAVGAFLFRRRSL